MIELASGAKNPASTFSIRTQNRDFKTEGLTDEEAELFEQQFNILINDFDTRHLTSLYKQREEQISDTAGLAKSQFDEKLFGGINAADNEIGFDVLRPGHIRADPADGSIINNWKFEVYESGGTPSTDYPSVEGTGWHDFIGAGTSDTDYSIDEDQVAVILGFMDQAGDTGISGINVERFGRNVDMIPKDLNDARTLDNENELAIQALPTLVGTERDRVHIRIRADETGVYEPRLVGFTFGVGSYMNNEEF